MDHYLSANNTKALKGLMAIAVVFSHIYTSSNIKFENPVLSFLFGSFLGYVPVSVFFFLSGYGLMSSYKNRGKTYIQEFPKNRIVPFYFYCVCMILLYSCLRFALREEITWIHLFKSLTWGGTVIQYGWYLQTILVLYILFWVCFSIKIKDSYKVCIFSICIFVLYFLAFVFSVTPTWYATAPCLLLGMLWKIHNNKIDNLINNRWKKWTGIFASLFACVSAKIASSFLPADISYVFQVTSTAIFFVIAIVLFLKGLSLINPITTYLGKISLEIYVFQGIVIKILQKATITNLFFYATLVLTGTILMASAFNPLLKKTNKIATIKNRSNRNDS